MSRLVPRAVMDAFGGEITFQRALTKYQNAVAAWVGTTGVPRPTAHPLVEEVADHYIGQYTIVEPPPVPVRPTVQEKVIEDWATTRGDVDSLIAQFNELFTVNAKLQGDIAYLRSENDARKATIDELTARVLVLENKE